MGHHDEDVVTRSIAGRDVTEWGSTAGRLLASGHDHVVKRIGGRGALVVSLVAGVAVATTGAFAVSRFYDDLADRRGIVRVDRPMLRQAKHMRNPLTVASARVLGAVFGPIGMPILTVAGGALLSLRERNAAPLITVAGAGLGSLALTTAGKDIIHRHRPPRRDALPPYERSPSFPSGHTVNTTAIVGTFAYLTMLRKRSVGAEATVAASGGAIALTVGASRILMGAHWFSDVVTGWVAGLGWLSLVVTAHRLFLTSEQGRSGIDRRQ